MSVTRTMDPPDGKGPGSPEGGREHEERALIDALFPFDRLRSSLSPRDWKRLFEHLRDADCHACQEYFAERRRHVLGDAELLSDHEIGAIIDAVGVDGARKAAAHTGRLGQRESTGWRAAIRWAWAGGGLVVAAACAALVLSPANPFRREHEAHEKGGGVSAELYCMQNPEKPEPLTSAESFCAPDAQVVARAIAAPDGKFPHLTIASCDEQFRCRLVSGSSFGAKQDLVAAGPRMTAGERLRLFAIWSREPVSEQMLQEAAARARAQGKDVVDTGALPLVPSCPQVAFTIHARSTSPR